MNNRKLAVIALGKRNSGKSNTWYEIFGRTIRTGWKHLNNAKIYVRNSSYEEAGDEIEDDVFVRNASFEEWGDEAEDYFDKNALPKTIFCSVQYTEKGIRTINWFKDNGYYLYIQWLNPGYYYQEEYSDFLEFENFFGPYGKFTKHSGKEKTGRVGEIIDFLHTWLSKKSVH
jgi:hypothetical protein